MLHFGQFVLPSVSMGVIERPHSEILGSTVACTYPRLIAACHVLHHLSSRVILQPASLHQHYYQMFMYFNSFYLTEFPIWSICHIFCQWIFLFFCMTIITSHVLASSFISSIYEEIAYDIVTQYFTHDCPTSNLRRWSGRRFPYGHLVTTSPSLLISGSIMPNRTTSPKTNFDEATGGVCKEQGRIHRAMMTRDY
jgi:hypothetical protein